MATLPWQYSDAGWPRYSSGEDENDRVRQAAINVDYSPREYMYAPHGNTHPHVNHHNMGLANIFGNSTALMPAYEDVATNDYAAALPPPPCHQHPYSHYQQQQQQQHHRQHQPQQHHQHLHQHHAHHYQPHHHHPSHHLSLLTTTSVHQQQKQQQEEQASSYSYDSDTSINEPVIVSPRDLMCVPRNASPVAPPLSTRHWTATGRRMSMDAMASGECASAVGSSVSSPSSLNRPRQDAYLLAPSPAGASLASVDSMDPWCRLPPSQEFDMDMKEETIPVPATSADLGTFQHPSLMEMPFLNLATMPRSCAPSECDGEGDAESSDNDNAQVPVTDETTCESEPMEDAESLSPKMNVSAMVETSTLTSTPRRIPITARVLPSPPRDYSSSIDSTFDPSESSEDTVSLFSSDDEYADPYESASDRDNDYEPTTVTVKKTTRKCPRSPATDVTLPLSAKKRASTTLSSAPVVSEWERTSTGRYKCPHRECTKTFVRKFNGTTHYATHFDVRHFACPHCPRTFTRSYDLKRHCKLHQKSKPGLSDNVKVSARNSRR
ncbi:hypothetical protein HKX48_009280 [Thoreauomyces humboldtii]|nr:hypothetical protein HKX48_009280 [Thoreauomyces humboldtii]